jgi:site-specific DNA recombinase
VVTASLFERVQARFRERCRTKRRRSKHAFAFGGLLSCGYCGRAVTAELKKERYVYYHCAAPRSECARPFVNEKKLVTEFAQMLDRLHFDAKRLAWAADELRREAGRDREARVVAIRQLEVDRARLQRRLDVLYDDRLDGRIDSAAYDRRAQDTQGQLRELDAALDAHRTSDEDFIADGIALLEVAAHAGEIFREREGFDQRRLLDFVLSNCEWKPGHLDYTFRQPFGLIADAVGTAPAKGGDGAAEAASRRRWYTREGSNL